MRKLVFVIFLLTVMFISDNNITLAQENCNATLVVHYHKHKYDYDNQEIYVYNHQNEAEIILAEELDNFGLVFDIPICSVSKNRIGIKLDDNKDKMVDVSDIKGKPVTKHVYVLEGAKEVYEQEFSNKTYFGRQGYGHVVIIYYDPLGVDEWKDFYISDVGDENLDGNVNFDYYLGLPNGHSPELFRVGVINVPSNSEELISLMIRKNKSWDVKDVEWSKDLLTDETDEYGHIYTASGDRLINVNDVRGNGYKFIYIIKGDKTLYEDYDVFLANAFKIELTEATFNSKKALSIKFNRDITYNQETGPDKSQFEILDEHNNILNIDKITFDSKKSMGKDFNIVLEDEIENKQYTVRYNYEHFGQQKSTEKTATFTEGIFTDLPVEDINNNLIYYIIAGFIILLTIGTGAYLLTKRKK